MNQIQRATAEHHVSDRLATDIITSSASLRASSSLKLTDEVRKDIEFSSQNEQLTMKSRKKRAKVLKRVRKP